MGGAADNDYGSYGIRQADRSDSHDEALRAVMSRTKKTEDRSDSNGAQLDIFVNGLHWSYLTGALFSILSATAVFFSKSNVDLD